MIFAICLGSGCVPYYHSLMRLVKIESPAKFESAGDRQAVEALPSEWWRDLHDKDLNRLMDDVLAHNLDLGQAAARYQQSVALVKQAGAAALPSLALAGHVSRNHSPGLESGFTGDNYRLSMASAYEIDFWGKIEAGELAARLGQVASRDDLRTAMISVTAQTADLYFMAVEQRAQLGLIKRILAAYEDTLARVEFRYRAGLVSVADVYLARQNVMAAKVRMPGYEAGLEQTNNALAVLGGHFPEGERRGGADSLDVAWPPGPILVPAQLLKNRPDIRASFVRLQAQDAKTAAAVADRFPSFKLSADLGQARIDSLVGAATGVLWNLAADASHSLFDGGRRQAEVERNRAVFREYLARYRQVVLRAFLEVEGALVQIRAYRQKIRLLNERAEVAEAALGLAKERYYAGLADYMPVLLGQLATFEVESQIIADKRHLLSERISLMRATSTGIRDTDNTPRKQSVRY